MSYENGKIEIAIAANRFSKAWENREYSWEDFLGLLKTPQRSHETLQEYLKMTRAQQDQLKDVGGFVGGTLSDTRRKKEAAVKRDLVTLDLDNLSAGGTERVIEKVESWGCAGAIYSTRKHSKNRPRLRLILPLKESCAPDEYEPLARKIAEDLQMDAMDPTTFEVTRLMFFPSCCSDSEFIFHQFEGEWIDKDKVLGRYKDWRDVREWPVHPAESGNLTQSLAKAQDPTEKEGIIGAFCRVYDIEKAMEKFLPGVYTETSDPNRYTFAGGSTFGGAIIYEDGKFLYSHHATDPCSGQLVNAFDMVRLHKFSDLDRDESWDTKTMNLPSYKAMLELAWADKEASTKFHQEQTSDLSQLFPPEEMEKPKKEEEAQPDLSWMNQLATTKKGEIKSTINNAVLIIENDQTLKGMIGFDVFSSRLCAIGPLPWDDADTRKIWQMRSENGPRGKAKRLWTDGDDANLMNILETGYGVSGDQKIQKALLIVAMRHQFNDVADYLKSLRWDGVKRIDTALHDYLGAKDTPYTRAVFRKMMVAAVSRAIVGATKFDFMLILAGPQGIGKSTFLNLLGGDWFCDSLSTFDGKEAAEVIQGQWIIEVGELNAMSRTETAAVKQFLSKRDDVYREAYGKHSTRFPRRCVFFGTSNDVGFLKDQTGNRRFWPVDVGEVPPTKSIWDDLPGEVDQMWAEAVTLWRIGSEPLYLDADLEKEAKDKQEEHREVSIWEGIVHEYLDTPIPENWYDLSIEAMRLWWSDRTRHIREDKNLVPRDRVCAAEIWVVCLNGNLTYQKRATTNEINSILRNAKGWENKSTVRMGPFGRQRGYTKSVDASAS